MIDMLKNLLKVKSLVTLGLTGLFIYLGVTGVLPVETVVGVYGLVLGSLLRNNKKESSNDDEVAGNIDNKINDI